MIGLTKVINLLIFLAGYQNINSMTTVLEQWQHHVIKHELSIVLPDGCRDLIWIKNNEGEYYFITDLDNSAYSPIHTLHTQYIGYRLQPGTIIQEEQLCSLLKSLKHIDHDKVIDYLSECTYLDENICDVLQCLKEYHPIHKNAKLLGVNQRTLERLVYKYTERSPVFWRNLARVRQAAQVLIKTTDENISITDIAIICNFSDQAHMIREFQRWFKTTPKQFQENKQLYHLAFASGYH